MSSRHIWFRQLAALWREMLGWGAVGLGGLCVGGLALCTSASAQSEVAAAPQTEQRSDTPAEAQPGEAKPSREQTIYIPYTKLRQVFEKEGRGVFLPYSEFQKLWDAAREKPVLPEKGPPVDALVTEAENEAVVEQDVVRVTSRLTIELLKKGWLQIPLHLKDAALLSATIDGEPARVLPAPGGGYQLLLNNRDDQPRSVQLELEYARAFTKSPGKNSVAFDAPQAPVNRWRIRVPQAGVKINVEPLIAASEVESQPANDQPSDPPEAAADETVVLAFVGAAPLVRIDWTQKAEGAAGMTAIASVQATQEVFIAEGTLRTRAILTYDISRSALNNLALEVPTDFKVVNVFDANVRKWEVATPDNVQRIAIELFEPATSAQTISIELERLTEGDAHIDLSVPVIKAVDVGRQQGIVVVNVDPALRGEVTTRTGLLQLDTAELPASLKNQSWNFAYRYAALPFDLALSLVKVEPRITVEQFVQATIEPELLALDTTAVFDVAEAGVFQLEFEIPKGFEVRQVRGVEHAGAPPASVDAYHLEPDDETQLVINLNKKALGKTAVLIELEQRLNDDNLLSPTGIASSIPLVLPRPNQDHITRVNGCMLLYAPESLRINPTATTGLRAISLSEATADFQVNREARYQSTRPTLSFAFTDQAARLTLSVERRKPYITAKQRLLASADSGVVRFQSTIIYEILYSGARSLRIDVPSQLADSLRNDTDGVREAPIEPQPADVAAGYVAWSLTGQSELIGRHIISRSWEQKTDELSIGKSIEVSVPHLKPMNVDRAWGQIVLTKTESLDVQPAAQFTGLRPIDPQHDVMPEAKVPGAARAFEFHEDWNLKLNITRYQLEEVKHTSIERAVVRMVVTRSSQVGVQALYRLRSAHQRLTLKLPSDIEFDSQPARINGAPLGLERGDKNELYLPLVGLDPDRSFVLELRYTSKGSTSRLELPQFPEDPAVQKVYLNVFLPRERVLLGSSGPWTEEWQWHSNDLLRWRPTPTRSDDDLGSWVTEGIDVAASPPFQRDGTLYVFSSLKPLPPPAGSLRMATVNDKLLAGIVFGVLAAFALLLLRSPLRSKVAAVAALLIAVVLCGVLAPSLAQQLVGLPSLAGLAIVAIAWTAWYGYHAATEAERLRRAPVFDPAPVVATVMGERGTHANTKANTPTSSPTEADPNTGDARAGDTRAGDSGADGTGASQRGSDQDA